MRISTNSVFIPYERNLEEIQNRRVKADVQISTGKRIINMGDEPESMVQAKKLSNIIDHNAEYLDNIEESLAELYQVDGQLTAISDKFVRIRELAIEATQTGNTGNLYSLGVYVKGLLDDIIKDSNADFNGHFLFSGAKTTPDSLDKTAQAQNDSPYELIQDNPDANNPSGYKIVFKGNQSERLINKDAQTIEKINVASEDIFGTDGTEFFNSVIDLYNLLTYNSDGATRSTNDLFSKAEFDKLNKYQAQIQEYQIKLDNTTAVNGIRINRLENIAAQMKEEAIRLKEFRSMTEDADITRAAINLQKEETALQYSLQMGSRLLQNSLFDFLR